MSPTKKQLGPAEVGERLESLAEDVRQAESVAAAVRAARDDFIREVDGILPRSTMARLADISRSRLQQIVEKPWTHRVTFHGILTPEAEKSLTAAGIRLRFSHGGGLLIDGRERPPVTAHSVYVTAESERKALDLVTTALKDRGSFAGFDVDDVPSQ
jgi:hypothetical protein